MADPAVREHRNAPAGVPLSMILCSPSASREARRPLPALRRGRNINRLMNASSSAGGLLPPARFLPRPALRRPARPPFLFHGVFSHGDVAGMLRFLSDFVKTADFFPGRAPCPRICPAAREGPCIPSRIFRPAAGRQEVYGPPPALSSRLRQGTLPSPCRP